MIVPLLVENGASETPSVDELNEWADTAGSTHPVVTDPDWEVVLRYTPREWTVLPAMTLIAPGMEIITADGTVEEDDILALLP